MVDGLKAMIAARQADKFSLYGEHINAGAPKSLRRLGLDHHYVRAEGCCLYDADGNEYLDCDAGNGVFAIGRNHPRVRAWLQELLEMRPANWVARDTPLLAGLLAEAIAHRMPPHLSRVLFTNAGSETTEAALKYARRVSGRPRLLFLRGDFHGLSYGALSVTDTGSRLQLMGAGFGPMLPGCVAVPPGDPERLEKELAAGDVAALIVETIQGTDVNVLSGDFLRAAQALCRKYGTLLIADEILTGLGRTGTFLNGEQSGLEPDMVLLAKALSGGVVPAGALIVSEALYQRTGGAFIHGSTFGENDYGMAAGLAVLKTIDDERLVDNARDRGEMLMDGLRRIGERYGMIAQVRGAGLLIGVELTAPHGWLRQPSARFLHGKGMLGQLLLMLLMTRHRVLVAAPMRNNVMRLHPPLTLSEQQATRLLEAIEATFESLHRFPDGAGRALVAQLMRMARQR